MLIFLFTLYLTVSIFISIVYTVYYSNLVSDPIEILLVSMLWPLLCLELIYNKIKLKL